MLSSYGWDAVGGYFPSCAGGDLGPGREGCRMC